MEKEDLSNTVINENGLIKDVSGGITVKCPTCKGKGFVKDPAYLGRYLSYYNPITGLSCPTINCRTCSGEGWVFFKTK